MIESSRLPVGASSFEALRAGNMIYVDKTELVYRLIRCLLYTSDAADD